MYLQISVADSELILTNEMSAPLQTKREYQYLLLLHVYVGSFHPSPEEGIESTLTTLLPT
jgi:hypothetical protein